MSLGDRIHLLEPDVPPPSPLAPMQRYADDHPFGPGLLISLNESDPWHWRALLVCSALDVVGAAVDAIWP